MNEQEFQNLVEEGKTALGLTWDDLAVRIEEVTQGTIGWKGPATSPYDWFTAGKFFLLTADRATGAGAISSVQIHLGNLVYKSESIAHVAIYRPTLDPDIVEKIDEATITIPAWSTVETPLTLTLSKILDVEDGDYIGIVSQQWNLSGNTGHTSKDAGWMFIPPATVNVTTVDAEGPVVGADIAVPPDQWRLYFYEVIDGVIQYGTEEVWESWLT